MHYIISMTFTMCKRGSPLARDCASTFLLLYFYVDLIIVGQTQGWWVNLPMVLHMVFMHGFRHDGFFPWEFVDLVKGTMVMF